MQASALNIVSASRVRHTCQTIRKNLAKLSGLVCSNTSCVAEEHMHMSSTHSLCGAQPLTGIVAKGGWSEGRGGTEIAPNPRISPQPCL